MNAKKIVLDNVKSKIREHGVAEWIEAGVNVLETGDKLINKRHGFSRLDYFVRYGMGIEIVPNEKLMHGKCGCITLKNGEQIHYNIILP